MPGWPSGLDWHAALAYSGVCGDLLEAWSTSGILSFRPFGPEGGLICLRSELDRALDLAFAPAPGVGQHIIEDFDFDD